MNHLIGIDIGTSGAKSILLREDGKIVASDFQEYALSLARAGWAEQDPEDWWQATVRSMRNLLGASAIAVRDLAGLSFSGQMHGLVCLDAGMGVLRPAILWCDTRTTAQCREIEERCGGRASLIELTSNPALEGFTLPKLMWVREHEPKIFAQVRKILLPKDYVRFRLTGALGMDISDAAGTLMLDVKAKRWSTELLAKVGVDSSLLPPLGESPAIAGNVSEKAASETGLPEGLPVAFGGADNTCAAVGNGVIEEGVVGISVGTSGTVIAPTKSPVRDGLGRAHTFNHSVPDLWYVMGVMQAAGLSLKWFRENFAGEERAQAAAKGVDAYDLLMENAATVAPGAEGLLWLPYLNGERTPHLDANARGVLFGVTPRHTKAHVVRAILEGVAFGLRDSLEIIRSLGIPIRELRLTGGGARSPLWRQMMADIFEESLSVVAAEEGPAFGAAIIAGVGTRVFSSFDSACEKLIRVSNKVEPDRASAAAYKGAYARFRRLYVSLKQDFAAAAR